MMKKVVEEVAMVLEAEVEVVAEAAVENKKKVKMRSTKTHMSEVEAEEGEDQVSLIFNVIVVKSSVLCSGMLL
jgi:hypothetical protein